MQAIEIMESLKNKKGQHVKATWLRRCDVRKGSDVIVTKRTEAYIRSGISYANLSDIKNAIEAGEREPVQGLPWGEWREGYVNYIIDHKDKEYLRLYPAVFDNLKPHVEWTLNGKVTTYEACEPYLLAKDRKKDEDEKPKCFTVKAEDVVSIAGD